MSSGVISHMEVTSLVGGLSSYRDLGQSVHRSQSLGLLEWWSWEMDDGGCLSGFLFLFLFFKS